MAHQIYENIVLSNKINDILTTGVNINNYMTIDNSLAENAGMKKKVITYTSTGSVEALGMGEGNKTSLEVKKSEAEYEVLTYQGKFAFYDEEEMTDPMVVDTGLKHSADNMVNTFTANATTNKTINIPVPTDNSELANGCGYAKAADLCTVATSGKYCDLTGTPTIPTDNCQLAN